MSRSGIAALATLPGESQGDVNLQTPHGKINAGAAGIRANRVTFVAPVVLNAFNVTANVVVGVPTVPSIPAALTAATSVAGKQTKLPAMDDATKSEDRPSVIIVEFLGFGGKDPSDDNNGAISAPRCESEACGNKDRRSQNPDSPFQVLGAGEIADDQALSLIAQRRVTLVWSGVRGVEIRRQI